MPQTPATAALMGDAASWAAGLTAAGIDVRDEGAADLVVAPASSASAALERAPEMLLLQGDATRELRAAGYRARTYLPIPSAEAPRAWLPLDAPVATDYALGRWTVPSTRLKRARNRVLARLIRSGRAPLRSSWVTVGARSDPVPWFVQHAATRVDATIASWFFTVGAGESLDYRGVFHLFSDGAATPGWIVKFARRPGLSAPFERDRTGLEVASSSAGTIVSEHAPRLVDSFEHSGVPASIETAAVGAALSALLRSRSPRAPKLKTIESIASWITEVGARSAEPGKLGEERDRLAHSVLPEWGSFGLEVDLLPLIGDVPAVMQHNDLWSENVVVDGSSFTIVDWEDARRHGLPLWDLVYFLADALALLDGAHDDRARHAHFVALFKGTARSSEVLFKHVRNAAAACALPDEAIGPIVTACWLSQVLAHATRGEDAARFAVHGLSVLPPGEQWATLWLKEPELGPAWPAWRAWRTGERPL